METRGADQPETPARPRHRLLIPGAVAAVVALVVVALVVFVWKPWSGGHADDTTAGNAVDSSKIHDVFGHLFDGVGTVHVDYRTSTAGTLGSADVILGPPLQATIALSSAQEPAQGGMVVIKDGRTLVHFPSLDQQWLVASTSEDGVSDLPAFGQTAFELQFLGPKTTATYVGPETVGGIPTRKYEFTAQLPSSASPSPAAKPVTVATVWIDGNGRLVQYAYSPAGDGQYVTATYSKWGEPVTVTAPPDKDIKVLEGAM